MSDEWKYLKERVFGPDMTREEVMQTATFRGQQGRISRPVRAILSGQF